MNPRQELKDLIQKLESDIHAIRPTPRNALRIADRRRELVRAMDLLHKLEGRTTPVSKVRTTPSREPDDVDRRDWERRLADDRAAEFPSPNPTDDPDMFLGTAGENLPVCDLDPIGMILRRCQEGRD